MRKRADGPAQRLHLVGRAVLPGFRDVGPRERTLIAGDAVLPTGEQPPRRLRGRSWPASLHWWSAPRLQLGLDREPSQHARQDAAGQSGLRLAMQDAPTAAFGPI